MTTEASTGRVLLGLVAAGSLLFTVGCEGPSGAPGADGQPGAPGASCAVVDNGDGTKTITCPGSDPVTVIDGTDATPCTVDENSDGSKTVTCPGSAPVVIEDGVDGENGQDGTACTVRDNGNGTKTISCTDGTSVDLVEGQEIAPVSAGAIKSFHGEEHLLSSGEFAEAGKKFVTATITGATASEAGEVTVEFTVFDGSTAVQSLDRVNALIAKLVPAPASKSPGYSAWVDYIQRVQTVTGSAEGDWPNPDGTKAAQGTRENKGTLTALGDGAFRYVFSTNISNVVVDGAPIAYERALTHRVQIMIGGHSGPTAEATHDFVPDGSAVTVTRDLMSTSSCTACHGFEFHGHGGDRLTLEGCVTCHTSDGIDPHGGESIDMTVMTHKIHAGGALDSAPGPDGILWDDPATDEDESADNFSAIGKTGYAIWANRNTKHAWGKGEFPAVIENCQKCHNGTGAQVDNWKKVPSRKACGSCHDATDFADHWGEQTTDFACTGCHPASGVETALIKPIVQVHEWYTRDPRNLAEFEVDLGVSSPANGTHFVKGERPVVTLILTDVETGLALDHTLMKEASSSQGCSPSGCEPRDNLFRNSKLMVYGPRANRVPALTHAARAAVVSPTAGPWNLTGATSLALQADNGQDVVVRDASGGDKLAKAAITVPVVAGAFVDPAAATNHEVVAWLNANAAFAARAIAYLEPDMTQADPSDPTTMKVGIRSRNLGRLCAMKLEPSDVTTTVYANDTGMVILGGSTTFAVLAQRTKPADEDPLVERQADKVVYTLDPVDDLQPGTYVAYVEIADRGRVDGANYKTPSVAKATFQVKAATEEPLIARNCDACHQHEGVGFVLDHPRHNKLFDDTAVDGCAACHDYLPGAATGSAFSGSKAISKRVHAVHAGATLNYPLATVEYSNGDPIKGRNWEIVYPMDLRNCESCHPDGTSGTWATQATRLACSGCHDSDAASAHMKLMVFDPTPANAWSGDEGEACMACH